MSIRLGNLSLEEMQEMVGVEFSKEFISLMEDKKQDDVQSNIKCDKWHCFHIPFELVVGEDLLEIVKKHLVPIGNKFEVPMQISVSRG